MQHITTTVSAGSTRVIRPLFATILAIVFGALVVMVTPATASAVTTPTSTDQFNLRNLATGKCVDLPGFGRGRRDGSVQQYTCDYSGRDNQEWQLVRTNRNQSPAKYLIKNRKDGYCLDLPNFGKVKATTKITEYTCNPRPSRDNQEFYLRPTSKSGYHKFVHVKSPALCLDVDGVRTGRNDARLTLWTCSKVDSADDHLWELRTGTRAVQIEYAISVAKQQAQRYPKYAWGGGHGSRPGPSRGYCDKAGNGTLNGKCVAKLRIGYDCSGLMRYVFAKATGWDWGNMSTRGLSANRPTIFGSTLNRVSQLKRGDLVLLDTGGKGVNHTGIVSRVTAAGRVWIIEAPNTRANLREAPLHGKFVKAYRLR